MNAYSLAQGIPSVLCGDKEGIYVHTSLLHFAGQQRLTQRRKATEHQWKGCYSRTSECVRGKKDLPLDSLLFSPRLG